MSTKPIREALEMLRHERSTQHYESMLKHDDAYTAALEAVRAIEEMARSIVHNGGADSLIKDGYDMSVELLESIAKEAP